MWLPVITGGSKLSGGHVPTTLPTPSTSTRRPRSSIHVTTRSRPSLSASVSASRLLPPPSMAPSSPSASSRARSRGNEIRSSSMLIARRSRSQRDVSRSYRHAHERPSGGGADRGDDSRRRGDRRRLTDALGAERRARLGFLDVGGAHGWSIERGGDEVVGEARVAHASALEHELLHHGEADSLRDA